VKLVSIFYSTKPCPFRHDVSNTTDMVVALNLTPTRIPDWFAIMKYRYRLARTIISSRIIRQKYLSSIFRRLLQVPRCEDIENEAYIIDNFYGLKFYGELQSLIEWEVYFFGTYDRHGLELTKIILMHLDKPVCLDIGANVGVYSLFMSTFASKIYSFEPLPRNYTIFQKNVALNHLTNIDIHTYGLSNEDKVDYFYVNKNFNYGAGSFDADHQDVSDKSEIMLQLKIGDNELSECKKIDFIKMDIEGFEYQAIRGLQNTLVKHRPILMMEYNRVTRKKFDSYDNMLASFPEDYEIVATELYKYPNLKRIFDTEYLRLAPFDFQKNYEHIIVYPKERQLQKILVD
jgi:FkbM family methyltransferase